MNPEYLVTGGAGFIGSNIVKELVSQHASVRVLDNFSTGRRENLESVLPNIDLIEGDIRNTAVVEQAVKGVRHILHLGALASVIRSVNDPIASNDVNIGGTLNLLVAARDHNVKTVVFSSSSSVYGDTEVLPKREDMPPQPKSPYALNKLTGEVYCRLFYELYGLKTIALRYFNVFGPSQSPDSQYAAVIPLFFQAYRSGKQPTIFGDGEQTRDFSFVKNVVNANLACCKAPDEAAGKVFNVGNGTRYSVNDLAKRVAELNGQAFNPFYKETRAGDVRDSQADITQAMKYLDWKPEVSFEEGLQQTHEWFESSGDSDQ